MTEINYDTWERREAYEFFSGISNPFYMVTFKLDVTDLYDFSKARGISFYKSLIWVCTKAMNQIDAFRITSKDGKIFMLDRRNPSFTDMKPGGRQFYVVTMDYVDDIEIFCREAKAASEKQNFFIDKTKETESLVYYSCLPWIEMTALTNERDYSSPDYANDSIPHIAWGKYTEEGNRKKLGFSIEINHRFVDGVHIGMLAEKMEAEMNHLKTSLTGH